MIVSVTKAAKLVGLSRTTVYEKINTGELSRTSEGIDTAELLRVFGELKTIKQSLPEAPISDSNDMVNWLRKQIDAKDQKLEELDDELTDTQQRLTEHREAARALMSPDEFDAKLRAEADKIITAERELQRLKNDEWQAALAERQQEIKSARDVAATLKVRHEEEAIERQKLADQVRALESRGLLARLLNRKPAIAG